MAKIYIRATTVSPTNTIELAEEANKFIANATQPEPDGGGLSVVSDVDIEFHNNFMFVIMKDLT